MASSKTFRKATKVSHMAMATASIMALNTMMNLTASVTWAMARRTMAMARRTLATESMTTATVSTTKATARLTSAIIKRTTAMANSHTVTMTTAKMSIAKQIATVRITIKT